MPYHWQAVDHGASISAERNVLDHNQIDIEIWVGERAMARISMWAEELERMTKEALR